MTCNPVILLSFDVEEFDLPLEYNQFISLEQQLETGKKGMDVVEQLCIAAGIQATMFVTGRFALAYTETVKRLSGQHEIASHTLNHSSYETADLLTSKNILENITGKQVSGLRMPRLRQIPMSDVKNAGYLYDSSINPTYLPGRYDHRDKPRIIYSENDILRLPVSVTPNFRIPLFWLSFKNFPLAFYKKLALQTLKKDGYLSLYFHPWEFISIKDFSLPFYIKRYSGEKMADQLNKLLIFLRQHASFSGIDTYLRETNVYKDP